MPARPDHRLRSVALFLFVGLLAGCSNPDIPAPAELNARYESVLADTRGVAANFVVNGPDEVAALGRLEQYFAAMTPDSVRSSTGDVYAENGWLYDNLTIVEGADNIEKYFAHASGQARGLRIEFLQVARDDIDYFVRWRMSIDAPALNGGNPLVSFGITQFRFDASGKVLVHRDFWDAGTGMYEYLPGVGGFVAALRGRLAAYE